MSLTITSPSHPRCDTVKLTTVNRYCLDKDVTSDVVLVISHIEAILELTYYSGSGYYHYEVFMASGETFRVQSSKTLDALRQYIFAFEE